MEYNQPTLESVKKYRQDLAEIFSSNPFVVFLCGPTLSDLTKPGAQLRKDIKVALESDGFEVVLGEDDGLEDTRLNFGLNAQDNEMEFIKKHCNAIVIVGYSVGSYCELGLFSYQKAHKLKENVDFILLLDETHEEIKSYLNVGPATAVNHTGRVFYTDLRTFDIMMILERLRERRSIWMMDKRGRSRKK